MAVTFNADEILALAQRIEQQGATFYRHAAELVSDATTRDKLLQLAEWEGSHNDLFSRLRRQLHSSQRQPLPPDPDDDTLLYLNAMAARHVLNQGKTVREILGPNPTTRVVLELAVGFERDSIVLFQALEAYVPAELGKEQIRALVSEEIGHVAYLVRERARLDSDATRD